MDEREQALVRSASGLPIVRQPDGRRQYSIKLGIVSYRVHIARGSLDQVKPEIPSSIVHRYSVPLADSCAELTDKIRSNTLDFREGKFDADILAAVSEKPCVEVPFKKDVVRFHTDNLAFLPIALVITQTTVIRCEVPQNHLRNEMVSPRQILLSDHFDLSICHGPVPRTA